MTREQRLVSLRPEAPKTKGTSRAAPRRTNTYEGIATFDARMRALREHEVLRAKTLAERRLPLMGRTQLLAVADRRALVEVEIDGEPVTLEEIKALGEMIEETIDLYDFWRRTRRRARLVRAVEGTEDSERGRAFDARADELKGRCDRAWTVTEAAFERVRRAGREIVRGDGSRAKDYRHHDASTQWKSRTRKFTRAVKEFGGHWDDEADDRPRRRLAARR